MDLKMKRLTALLGFLMLNYSLALEASSFEKNVELIQSSVDCKSILLEPKFVPENKELTLFGPIATGKTWTCKLDKNNRIDVIASLDDDNKIYVIKLTGFSSLEMQFDKQIEKDFREILKLFFNSHHVSAWHSFEQCTEFKAPQEPSSDFHFIKSKCQPGYKKENILALTDLPNEKQYRRLFKIKPVN